MPLVTVLMPVHNGALYLREAMDSVLRQTLSDLELLVVDDGSQDETPNIVRSYADPRIRNIRSEARLRLAGALNLGLKEARGEFVARMDADDICREDRLERLVARMRRGDHLDLCGSAIDSFGPGAFGRLVYPAGTANIRAHLLFDNPFAHPTVLFRRSIFDSRPTPYDVSYYPSEDYALWASLVPTVACDNIVEPLLRYRVHATSMTRADLSDMDRQSMRIQKGLLRNLGIDPTDDELCLHRFGCTNRLFPRGDKAVLRKLGAWFQLLQQRNEEARVYPGGYFDRCLHKYWYAACYRELAELPDAASIFYNAGPKVRGWRTNPLRLVFLLAWVKNRLGRG